MLSLLVMLVLAVGVAVSALGPGDMPREAAAVRIAEGYAANMMVHHGAARAYAQDNPGFSGVVPMASLTFPSWYRTNGPWRSEVSAGAYVITYPAGPLKQPGPLVGRALSELTEASFGAGIADGAGGLQSMRGNSVLPVPLPAGTPAMITYL